MFFFFSKSFFTHFLKAIKPHSLVKVYFCILNFSLVISGSNPPANNSSGFWDNIANNTSNSKPSTNISAPGTGNVKAATNAVNKSQKTSSTVSSGTVVTNSNNSAVTNNKNVTNSNNSAKATKGNKQKETNMSPKATPLRPAKNDEFSQWCHKAISNIKTSVDGKYLL